MATPAKFTLTNIRNLQLMRNQNDITTGVCITPTIGGMSVDGNVDIGGGLSVVGGLGYFTRGVSISGGASIGPFFIGDGVNLTNNGVLVIDGTTGVIGTSAFPAGGGGTTNPAGSTRQIQYNDGGNFGADSSFTWTEGTSTLGVSGSISVLGGPITLDTAGGVSSVSIQDNTANTGGEIILYSNPGGTPTEAVRLETADNSVGTGAALLLTNSGNTSSDVGLYTSGPNNEEGELLMYTKTLAGASTTTVNLRAGKTTGVTNKSGGILELNRLDTNTGASEKIITLDSTTQEIYINNTSGVSTAVLDSVFNRGRLILYNSGGNIPIITLNGSGDNIVFQNAGGLSQAFGMSSSQTTDGVRFILPINNGTNGHVLQTDGNGNLSYTNTSGFGVSELGALNDAYTDATNIILGPQPKPNPTGSYNTAIGISALLAIGAGTSNTVVGYNAGVSLSTGSANVAIGNNSLIAETTGVGSVAVGYNTLRGQTNTASENAYNTAVGWGAGSILTTGTSSTFIGACAGSTGNSFTGHNITCLGFGAQPSAPGVSNEITLGNSQIEHLRCSDQTICSLSDARDKNDIRDLSYGLNFLENVRPVEFTWDRRVLTPDDNNDPKQGKRRAGFIAQELQEAMPNGENDILDLVYTSNPQRLEAKYGNLIPVMVKAIQDLKQEVDTIKEHLNLE